MLEDINIIKNEIQEYIEVKLDLLRLHTAENISRIFSNAINAAIIGYLLLFILLFLSFAAGYFFASILHSYELGFLSVAGLYLLVLIIFLFFGKYIVERQIIRAIMKLFFPKIGDNEK